MCLLGTLTVLVPAGAASAQASGVALPPQSQGSCAGQVPIVVGSDAAAQSDIYAAAMLAGVIGSDCIVLAGPRGEDMPADQQARLQAANAGGFVVGGIAAVPTAKVADRAMTRLSGSDRWETARLVGRRAAGDTTAGDTTAGTSTDQETIEALFAHAAAQRFEIVAELTRQITAGNYGIDSDNVLRGPAEFRIDLDHCPDDWSNTVGVTETQIRIGYSAVSSGALAAYGNVGRGMENYFDWVNDNDPVAGREIVLISKDDAYVAAQTVENVDALINDENVLSITTLGTPGTLATYNRLNDECIPQPFAQSGHPAWGDPVVHPWTTGSQTAWSTEAILWGAWIEQNLAGKLPVSVAAVVMDNYFGVAYEQAFAEWAEAHPEVVSSFTPVRHDPAAPLLATEMQAVANANPDVYISMTAGNPCLLAIQAAGSNGLTASIKAKGGALFTSSACRSINLYMKPVGAAANDWLIVGGGIKDTTDQRYAGEPFIKFLNQNLEGAGLDPSESLYGSGYLFGYPYVEALRIAAELPGGITRTNLILAVRSLDFDHSLYLDGIRFRLNGNADPYPIEGSDILRYDADAESWGTPIEIIDVEGQTPNCVWISDVGLQGAAYGFTGCSTTTRERLTTISAHAPAGESNRYWSRAQAYHDNRDGPQYRLKPGYWAVTSDSLCLDADEVWRQGSGLGQGWIDINGTSVEVNRSTRVRIEHGDHVTVTAWSGGNRGATRCQLDWVADLG